DKAHGAGVVLLILVVAVAAPIVEEIFFRGLVLRSLERRMSRGWAIVVSSAVFGAAHFEPLQFPALFLFGLVAAILATRTGRLGPGIWAHVAFNAVAVAGLLL
ncbi:MAG: protease family protein, partial [Actinomycetota bacterium]|nr:protease family protein [Actinomycetota bacterium]